MDVSPLTSRRPIFLKSLPCQLSNQATSFHTPSQKRFPRENDPPFSP